ncbi:protein Aster-A-like [Sycon ciliatum]|uniref:protein Aster-A-like n=1 Tax=Sycon ciliatum TaxID=27933 RepID=UPI0031F71E0B
MLQSTLQLRTSTVQVTTSSSRYTPMAMMASPPTPLEDNVTLRVHRKDESQPFLSVFSREYDDESSGEVAPVSVPAHGYSLAPPFQDLLLRAQVRGSQFSSSESLQSICNDHGLIDMSSKHSPAVGANDVAVTSDADNNATIESLAGNGAVVGSPNGSAAGSADGGKRSSASRLTLLKGKSAASAGSPSRRSGKSREMQVEFERHRGDGAGAPLNRRKSWSRFNSAVKWLRPSNKSRNEDFRRLFGGEVPDAVVVDDYSCAVHREILAHGRMYVCQEHFCFYANIFGWETFLVLPCKNILSIVREKTAHVIPNAIRITVSVPEHSMSPQHSTASGSSGSSSASSSSTSTGRRNKDGTRNYFFTSFVSRETSFQVLMKVWQNVLIGSHMNVLHLRNYVCRQWGHKVDTDEAKSPCRKPPGHGTGQVDSEGHALGRAGSIDEFSDVEHGDPSLREASSLGSGSDENPDASAGEETKDNEDDDSGVEWQEDECGCDEHKGKVYIDRVVCQKPSALFKLIFTPSPFMQDFYQQRGFFAMEIDNWEPRDNAGSGDVLEYRKVSYKMPMDIPMGPKFASSLEEQSVLSSSHLPNIYIVQKNVTSSGVPMGNAFSTCIRACITRGKERGTSRIVVSGSINFHKSMLSMMKKLIEREATAGMGRYFTALSESLDHYFSEDVPDGESSSPQSASVQRAAAATVEREDHRHGSSSDGAVDSDSGPKAQQSAKPKTNGQHHQTTTPLTKQADAVSGSGTLPFFSLPRIAYGLLLLLGVLIVVVLLRSLVPSTWQPVLLLGEDSHISQCPVVKCEESPPFLAQHESRSESISDGVRSPPHVQKWVEILQLQHALHEQQISQWQNLLHLTSSTLMNVSIALNHLLHRHTELIDAQLQACSHQRS